MSYWPTHKVAKFRRLRAEGKSHAECAEALGTTIGACCAKWDRLTGRAEIRGRAPRERRAIGSSHGWTEEALTERWGDRHK